MIDDVMRRTGTASRSFVEIGASWIGGRGAFADLLVTVAAVSGTGNTAHPS